jgi:hypothetical protein
MVNSHRVTPEHGTRVAALPGGDGGDEVIVSRLDGAAHVQIVSRRGDILF